MKVLNINQLPLARNRLNLCLYQVARSSSSSSQNEEYQYLHRSNMPTYYFQKSLPRLPLPKAEKTLQRYLAAQRPLLNDEEFKTTQENCTKFMKSGE
jgi:carnitine O-palmitoyltransferase 2